MSIKNKILYATMTIGVIALVFFLLIFPSLKQEKKTDKEEFKYDVADQSEVKTDDTEYMDDEYPFNSIINTDEIIMLTGLDEFEMAAFPFYLDEYLSTSSYSDMGDNGYYHIKYIDGSYLLSDNNINKCIQIQIKEIPHTYFDCKYNIEEGYWTFRDNVLNVEQFRPGYYEPIRLDPEASSEAVKNEQEKAYDAISAPDDEELGSFQSSGSEDEVIIEE